MANGVFDLAHLHPARSRQQALEQREWLLHRSGSNELLVPWMAWWINLVKVVIADCVVLPADRIVQRVGTCIPPMPIEIIFAQRRLRSGELEEFVRCQNRNLGCYDFRLCYRDGNC